ncbi:MAG TPA: peptidoglycan-binding domain-containing protein [Solirubrobacteraceae bacterium]|nr:peptidoglycan-binding domain-containing protein [Solirubrobacteraceae bacterium]
MLAAAVTAACLGPAAAIALAGSGVGSGGTGLAGGGGQSGSTTTTILTTTTGTTVSTSTIVKITTPCSGSLGSSNTTTAPAVTTTVPTTTTVTTTATTDTTETDTETGTDTTGAPTTTTVTTTVPVTTPVTTTVPATATETTPGITTVTTTPACPTTTPAPSAIAVPKTNPFNRRAMWIWEMHYSDGGNVAAIIAQAKRYGIGAVYIKSSDGTSWWPQFSRELVTELHEAGLKVCAWQYVYGQHPLAEANLGSRAAHDGADCLVIDAESQYQSRYIAAQTYITQLRKLIGKRYPVGLAGFPYVDYHLSFPYSVFLGTNGAQYNLPQMYWADIGTTVPFIFAHTYEYNEIYRRPIYPLGQLWGKLSATSIEDFDLYAKAYGATGVSWWDWQSAPLKYFSDITKTPRQLVSYNVNKTPASVFRGNKGDLVIWAQQHLYGAGFHIAVDGQFGPLTQAAVKSFQRRHKLTANGVINGLTWDALLKVTPVNVRWTRHGKQTVAVIARDGGTTLDEPEPSWMKRARSRNELHRDVGEGGSADVAKR